MMLRDTYTLIRLYQRISRAEAGGRWKYVLRLLFIALGAIVLGTISFVVGLVIGVGAQLLWELSDGRFNLGAFPGVLFTGVLTLMVVWDFRTMLTSLYLSGDLERLMVAPIDTRAVFIAKLLRGIRWNFLTIGAGAGIALLVYGVRLNFGLGYFILCALVLICIPLLGKSLSALVVMLLTRFIPAKRLNEAYTALVSIITIGFYILMQFGRGEENAFANSAAQSLAFERDAAQAIGQFGDIPLPTMFLGRGVAEAGSGQFGLALLQLGLFLAAVVGLFIFAVGVAQRLYSTGILELAGVGTRRRRANLQSRAFTGSSVSGAIVRKDWLLRVRDLRLIAQQLGNGIYLLFVLIPLIASVVNGAQTSDRASLQDVLSEGITGNALLDIGLALYRPGVVSMVVITAMMIFYLANLVNTAVPLEGKQFEILKAAPIEPRAVLFGKFLSVYLPYAAVITVASVAFAVLLRLDIPWTIYGWLASLMLGAGVLGFQQGISGPHAKLDWEDPLRMQTQPLPGIISGLGGLLLALLLGILVMVPFALAAIFPPQWPLFLVGGLAVIAIFSGLLHMAAMAYGSRRLFRLGG